MKKDISKTLSSPINFPISEKQALAVMAAQCATEITVAVANIVVGKNNWESILDATHKRFREEIYKFISK